MHNGDLNYSGIEIVMNTLLVPIIKILNKLEATN